MGQEIQVRISEVNVDNNTVNLSMIPANNYDDRNGKKHSEAHSRFCYNAKPLHFCTFLSRSMNSMLILYISRSPEKR